MLVFACVKLIKVIMGQIFVRCWTLKLLKCICQSGK